MNGMGYELDSSIRNHTISESLNAEILPFFYLIVEGDFDIVCSLIWISAIETTLNGSDGWFTRI